MNATNPSGAHALAHAINGIVFDKSIIDRPHLHALVLATRIAVNRKTQCLSREEITLLYDCLVAQPMQLEHAREEADPACNARSRMRLAYDAEAPLAAGTLYRTVP